MIPKSIGAGGVRANSLAKLGIARVAEKQIADHARHNGNDVGNDDGPQYLH
jgi:hypothetical protein